MRVPRSYTRKVIHFYVYRFVRVFFTKLEIVWLVLNLFQLNSTSDPTWFVLIELCVFYFRVALNYFITVPNRVYSLLVQIDYQIRLAHVFDLLLQTANTFRMNCVLLVVKLSVQVIARSKYNLQASVVIISNLLSNDFKWFIIIPFEAIHATIWIISNVLEYTSRLLFYWMELIIIFVRAFMIRQNLLIVFTLTLAIDAKDVLYIPGVIYLPLRFQIRFDCYSEAKFVLVQI